MAQNDGRREVVNDPLAASGREVQPERSLALQGVRAPSNGGSQGAGDSAEQMSRAFGNLQAAYSEHVENQKDKWITEGKMAYMSGKTEAELIQSGNRFTQAGYQQLKARDTVNNWYMQEAAEIDEARNRMDPQEYQKYLGQKRGALLDSITDPYAKKVASAAFEQFSPELVRSQFVKNNAFERDQRIGAFTDTLLSIAQTGATTSKPVDGSTSLKLAPNPVHPVMSVSARDRDIGIRTMLGEAANEGDTGLAAVAHVMRNRAVDGRWPKSIAGVALQDKQFSAWNAGAGGNNLVRKYKPGDAMYEKAARVFDAVMSGRHVDPTSGATHYYSPNGMKALVSSGSQTNTVPNWLRGMAAESGGTIQIGGHIFAGRAKMPEVVRQALPAPEQTSDFFSDRVALAHGDAETFISQVNEVAAQEGAAVTGIDDIGSVNEVQEFILGQSLLNPNDTASALATAMQSALTNGDDTLFREAGGIGMLMRLGASSADIQAVRNAEQQFDKKQLDNYDAEHEAWRSDLLKRAGDGTTGLDGILSEIDARVKQSELSDAEAKSLARNAADSIRTLEANGNDVSGNVEYLSELGGLYQQIKTGGLEFEDAAAEAKRVGSKYGAGADEVQKVIGQMFNLDQQRQDQLRRDAAVAAKKHQDNQTKKSEVSAALSRGVGLSLLTGSIDTVNSAGQNVSISKQEYGVQLIRDKHMQNWQAKQEAGEVSEADSVAGAIRDTYLELQKHGVVDKEAQAQLQGALTGNIMNKDGTVDNGALQAYDFYQILRHTPEITDGYIAKIIGDDSYVRGLLETAFTLDGGNMAGERALARAHELMNDPYKDMQTKLAMDPKWQSDMRSKVRDMIEEKTYGDGWFRQLVPEGEADRAMTGRDRAQAFVEQRAQAYHWDNEKLTPDVALKMAIQDLENSATVVAGNLILHPNQNLNDVMGVSAHGKNAADEAITAFMHEFGSVIFEHEDGNGSAWSERMADTAGRGIPVGEGDQAYVDPAMNMNYNPATGLITVWLYDDEKKGTLHPRPEMIDVREIGSWYNNKKREATGWTSMWDTLYGGVRDAGKAVFGE